MNHDEIVVVALGMFADYVNHSRPFFLTYIKEQNICINWSVCIYVSLNCDQIWRKFQC